MTTVKNAVFTTVFVVFIVLWHRTSVVAGVRWDWWVWAVCCGVVLLSCTRFFMHHPVFFPEIWLLSFPFLFGFFFHYICPTTRVAAIDELLWAFDSNFGCPQPWLGKMLITVPLSFWVCKLVWSFLPFLFVVLYILLPEFIRKRYLLVLVCTGCFILPLYALCPAAGPVYLFRADYPYPDGLPMHLLHPHPRFLQAGLPLNTTPSGHVAWALLLFWFAYKYCRKRVAVFFGITLIITATATLGLGEHYVIDLILSIPYAAAIWSLVERQWKRFGVLLSIVVFWLVALREGWAILLPMSAAWLLCGITLLSSLPWRKMEFSNKITEDLPSDAVRLAGKLPVKCQRL